jgi:hypothetical protein
MFELNDIKQLLSQLEVYASDVHDELETMLSYSFEDEGIGIEVLNDVNSVKITINGTDSTLEYEYPSEIFENEIDQIVAGLLQIIDGINRGVDLNTMEVDG